MKEIIAKLLLQKENLKLEEIKKEIKKEIKTNINTENLKNILNELEEERIIFYDKKEERYFYINKNFEITTLLSTSKGNIYFFDKQSNKIDLMEENLNGALAYSEVIIKKEKNNYKVVKIFKHSNDKIVCEVKTQNDKKYLYPIDIPKNYKIRISSHDMKKLADGDRILVKVKTSFEDNYLEGDFIKIICHRNEPNKELITIACSKDFDIEFSEEALKETEKIEETITDEEIKNRVDLRNETIFTIDGIDTKDMDDAISVKILNNGNYELGVHIADVSHYIKPNTKLWEEAQRRATSLYMIDSVIPMLPQKLSNGICSLNEGADRLTKSCIMIINKNGQVIDSRIVNSIIKSKKKMNYDSVNKLLENNIIEDGYEEFYSDLINMQKLSQIISKSKNNQGMINFANEEIKVSIDENDNPIEFNLCYQGCAEKLIENFMIMANETIASYFPQLPFVYRIHGIPDELKLNTTVKFITSLGYRLNKCGNIGSPKLIQSILNSLKDEKEYALLSGLLLRSMKKAEYNVDNIGHYGLALDNYTHFTSPIRRFPDLQVHSLLNIYMNSIEKINLNELEQYLRRICSHSSYKERQADAAERESKNLMMAKYMLNHIGEEFEGIIINNEKANILVRTNNLIYGKVLNLSEKDIEKNKYKMGSEVLLKVETVSLIDKTVYFSITKKLTINEKEKTLIKQKNTI